MLPDVSPDPRTEISLTVWHPYLSAGRAGVPLLVRPPVNPGRLAAYEPWALAEELTAIVFLEAWRRRAQVELERDEAVPWLLGVATNVLRNLRRSQRRYRAALERLPREHAADFAAEVEERLDDERQMRAALRALRQLPRADQDVLALCVWEELTYEQAALALGVPVGTVRSRLSRARARLRELTENGGHEWDERIATEEPT